MKPSLPFYVLAALALAGPTQAAGKIHLEAENAQQHGTEISRERPGYSGTGYVTGIDGDDDGISWTIKDAAAGIYNVFIRYAVDEEKGYGLNVNGTSMSGMFAPIPNGFGTQAAGKVELKAGTNRIAIERGWGYYDVDYIELVPATSSAPLLKPPAAPVDAQADARTRALKKFLVDNYGRQTLSGQYDAGDTQFVRDLTGKTPAIFGSDLIDYSPSRLAHGSEPSPTTEEMIRTVKNGQILSLSWHWNAPSHLIDGKYQKDGKTVDAPWWRGFDTDASTFDVQKALANPNSADYKLLISDIDSIAVQLKKLQAAGVPVLWRPLHEADGGWFWWGAHGPAPFKALWRLMYQRLTVHHNLHNLIWVYCGSPEKTDWYPGDQSVDIVGIDTYPDDHNDPLSSSWEPLLQRFNGKKLLALTEFKGAPNVEKMARYGVQWSYFVSWTDDLGPKGQDKDEVIRTYQSPKTMNLDGVKK